MANRASTLNNLKLTSDQQKLVVDYIPLVRKFVTARSREHLLEDLFSAGYEGLCRAALNWDPAKGTFSTYAAIWIKALVFDQFRKNITIQSINSRAGRKLYYAIPAMEREFQAKHGREPTAKELADLLDEDVAEVRTMMEVRARIATVSDEQEDDVLSVKIAHPINLEEEIIEADLRAKRKEAYIEVRKLLKPRDQIILARKHTEHDNPESFKHIAEGLGITRERVRQVNDRAVVKLSKRIAESHANLVD